MSKAVEIFCQRLAARMPFTVELLVNMQVTLAGCWWLSSDSAVMMGTAYWTPMKMPPVSALVPEETTFCRVLQMTCMAPLSGGSLAVAFLR